MKATKSTKLISVGEDAAFFVIIDDQRHYFQDSDSGEVVSDESSVTALNLIVPLSSKSQDRTVPSSHPITFTKSSGKEMLPSESIGIDHVLLVIYE